MIIDTEKFDLAIAKISGHIEHIQTRDDYSQYPEAEIEALEWVLSVLDRCYLYDDSEKLISLTKLARLDPEIDKVIDAIDKDAPGADGVKRTALEWASRLINAAVK